MLDNSVRVGRESLCLAGILLWTARVLQEGGGGMRRQFGVNKLLVNLS